jgi:hypothetical protein
MSFLLNPKPLTSRLQLLLRHGASPFTSVKRGIFKGRLAIDFVITAKSKEATSLLLTAMQQPQGWPISGCTFTAGLCHERHTLTTRCRLANLGRGSAVLLHENFSCRGAKATQSGACPRRLRVTFEPAGRRQSAAGFAEVYGQVCAACFRQGQSGPLLVSFVRVVC